MGQVTVPSHTQKRVRNRASAAEGRADGRERGRARRAECAMPRLGEQNRLLLDEGSKGGAGRRVGRKFQSARVATVKGAEVLERRNAAQESERGLDSLAYPRDSSRYSP